MTDKQMTDERIIELIGASTDPVVVAIREWHSSRTPPPGHQWIDGGTRPKCHGCATGDPYLDQYWPCFTLEVVAEVLEKRGDLRRRRPNSAVVTHRNRSA